MRGVVLARLALVILGTCVAAVIVPVYSALLPPRSPIFAELPEPNGHDAVLRACRQLNWSAMPSQDADETTAPTWRSFVNANTQAFDSLHTAVRQPSCVPVEYRANFTWLPWLQDQRSMVRALDVRCAIGLCGWAASGRSERGSRHCSTRNSYVQRRARGSRRYRQCDSGSGPIRSRKRASVSQRQ